MITFTRELFDLDEGFKSNESMPRYGEDAYPVYNVKLKFPEEGEGMTTIDQWVGVFKTILGSVGFTTNQADRLTLEENVNE